MNNIKTILFLLCSFFLTTMVHAQSSTDQRREMKREIFKTFHKRSYTGEYPLRKIPTLPSTTYQTIRRAKTEAPLFTDRVWFPGEWEEVKAIILTPYYENHVPGHENDLTWNAEPMVKDYANYYHKNEAGKWEIEGSGPYTTSMDTESDMGKVFLRLMDGIQKGGAEAWVRVSQQSDTALVYQALKRMGLRHDRLRFIFGQGSSIWYRDCGPICFYYGNEDRLAMLDFFYRRFNRALDDEIPSLLHRQMGIPNYITDFVWEGTVLTAVSGSVLTSRPTATAGMATFLQTPLSLIPQWNIISRQLLAMERPSPSLSPLIKAVTSPSPLLPICPTMLACSTSTRSPCQWRTSPSPSAIIGLEKTQVKTTQLASLS